MTASTLLVCSLYTLLLCVCCGYSLAPAIVNKTYGPVNGSVISLSTSKTVIAYLGIPFAKAERFEYPVPPDKWTSTLQANKIDKICPQPSLPSRLPLLTEDCLQLNVYVPGILLSQLCCGFMAGDISQGILYFTMVACWQLRKTWLSSRLLIVWEFLDSWALTATIWKETTACWIR